MQGPGTGQGCAAAGPRAAERSGPGSWPAIPLLVAGTARVSHRDADDVRQVAACAHALNEPLRCALAPAAGYVRRHAESAARRGPGGQLRPAAVARLPTPRPAPATAALAW